MHSSWMLEVSGIPHQKNEDCQQLIKKLAALTNIANFHIAQSDVLHQQRKMPQLFYLVKKSDRMNFFQQCHKLKGVTES